MRRSEKKAEEKVHNYKALIAQYYEHDPLLQDVKTEVAAISPDIEILTELNKFEQKIDSLIKQYLLTFTQETL